MKLLCLAPFEVYPPCSGANLRVFNLLKCCSREEVEIDLVTLCTPLQKPYIKQIYPHFKITNIRNPLIWCKVFAKMNILPTISYSSKYFVLKPLLKKFFNKNQYDIYQFEFPWFADFFDLVPSNKKVIYSSHNVESEWFENEINQCFFSNHFREKLFQQEYKALKNCHKIVAVSEQDRKKFVSKFHIPEDKIEVIPNGFPQEFLEQSTIEEKNALKLKLGFNLKDKIVLFVGGLVVHNIIAVEQIVNKIVTETDDPHIKFLIVGSVGKAFKNNSNGRLKFIGKVKEVIPYFRISDIAINPMLSGAGSNIKILEYLAASLPVITTKVGIRGFEELEQYVIIEDVSKFSKWIKTEVCLEPKIEQVINKYSWRNISLKYLELYSQLNKQIPLQ